MSLKGGKGGMVCLVESQREVWLVAQSELLENQKSLRILSKTQSFTPNEFYCFSYVLLLLAYFICLSFTFRKLEEREMLEIGSTTSLHLSLNTLFVYLGCWQAIVFYCCHLYFLFL